jgi:O-acetyl-ADP-ribose deacetylase (regulator of RNase III)
MLKNLIMRNFMKIKQMFLLVLACILTDANTRCSQNKTYQLPGSATEIVIELSDITKSKVEAVVNAANPQLAGGGGVCGAIFTAAGWNKLQNACNEYPVKNTVRCPTGQARVTDSFDLKAHGINYIIHAVGPDCRVITDPAQQDDLLKKAYMNSLILAETLQTKSIAFPFISSAIYAFSKERAARIAIESVCQYIQENKESALKSIHFALFLQEDFDLFCKIISEKAVSVRSEIVEVEKEYSMLQKFMNYLKSYIA